MNFIPSFTNILSSPAAILRDTFFYLIKFNIYYI